MPINIQNSEQYQGVIEKAGSPQNTTVSPNFQQVSSDSEITSPGIYLQPQGTGIAITKNGSYVSSLATKTPFDPNSISGLQLWLDASEGLLDTSGYGAVTPGQAVVGGLPDKSGNGHTVTFTASPTVGSINGVQAIALNGSTQKITTDSFITSAWASTGFTMFAVGQRAVTSSANQEILAEIFHATTYAFFGSVPSTNSMTMGLGNLSIPNGLGYMNPSTKGHSGVFVMGYAGDTAKSTLLGLNTLLSSPTDGSGQNSSASDVAYLNQPLSGTWGIATTCPIVIGCHGAGYFWNGAFGEVLLFNRLLTADEIASVQGYLLSKWGYDLPDVICHGDSNTSGSGSSGGPTQSQYNATSNWPNRLKALLGGEVAVSVRTFAQPGWSLGAVKALLRKTKLANALYNPTNAKKQTVILALGLNDLAAANLSGVLVYNMYRSLALDYKALGYNVLAVTVTPQRYASYSATWTQFDGNRDIFNNLVAANWQTFADGFCDHRNSSLETVSTVNYNADLIHMNDTGLQIYANNLKAAYNFLV